MIYILLPAYNEFKNLIKIFDKIEKLKNVKKKVSVILVDDCSSDESPTLLKRKYKFRFHYLRHKKNKGLSLTLETGFKKILKISNNKDLVVTLDSDNTHPISIIPKMIEKINNSILLLHHVLLKDLQS
jgi:glycosyltransferase involved in cell wall biosynthesis